MLGGIWIRATRQPDVVGIMGTSRPHLLPVHDVFITMTDRRGAQRSQVGARVRLGVANGEMHVTRQDSGKKLFLLFLGAVHLQRGPHGLQGNQRQRDVGSVGLVDEDLLLDRTKPQPPVLLGPADSEFSVGAHPFDHRPVGVVVPVGLHRIGFIRGDKSREVLPQFGLQLLLLGCQFDVHYAPADVEAAKRSRRWVGPPSSRVRSLMEE